MPRDVRQQPRRPQQIPGQQLREDGQSRQRGKSSAQHRRRQGGGEQRRGHPQHHQIRQRRCQGQRPKAGGAEGRGRDHNPQAGGNGGGKEAPELPGFPRPEANQGAVQPRRGQQQTRHGGKGQLQAHRRYSEGIEQQNYQQRPRQGRRRIALPPRQRGQQDKSHHHAGAHHRRRAPNHDHIEQQRRVAQKGRQPLPPEHQQAQQRDEKSAVKSGNGGDVHQPRFTQIRVALGLQTVPLAGEQSGDQARGFSCVKGPGALSHPAGQARREVS